MIDKRLLNCLNFLNRSKEKFSNRYDYSDVQYLTMKDKVYIRCIEHNFKFQQSPFKHLESKNGGCKYCCNNVGKGILKKEDFIKKSNLIHNFKFDYSESKYVKSNLKIEILCRLHGSFYQTPNSHLNGKGCPSCSKNKKYSKSELLEKVFDMLAIFQQIHGKYSYDFSNYVNSKSKIGVACPVHGVFEISISLHKSGFGCGLCSGKSKGEEKIAIILKLKNIKYERQKSFDGCKFKNKMQFDFYLPDFNKVIEYDGIQHFKPIDWFGGHEQFEIQKEKDKIKNEFCLKNKINLLRIPYNCENIEKILENLL